MALESSLPNRERFAGWGAACIQPRDAVTAIQQEVNDSKAAAAAAAATNAQQQQQAQQEVHAACRAACIAVGLVGSMCGSMYSSWMAGCAADTYSMEHNSMEHNRPSRPITRPPAGIAPAQ